MDCHTAELMINRYIRHNLTEKEMQSFLEHIETCSSCYEELETYYIVHEATKQLDQDEEDTVFNIKGLLEQDIRESWQQLKKAKRLRTIGVVTMTVSIAALLGFVGEVFLTLW